MLIDIHTNVKLLINKYTGKWGGWMMWRLVSRNGLTTSAEQWRRCIWQSFSVSQIFHTNVFTDVLHRSKNHFLLFPNVVYFWTLNPAVQSFNIFKYSFLFCHLASTLPTFRYLNILRLDIFKTWLDQLSHCWRTGHGEPVTLFTISCALSTAAHVLGFRMFGNGQDIHDICPFFSTDTIFGSIFLHRKVSKSRQKISIKQRKLPKNWFLIV